MYVPGLSNVPTLTTIVADLEISEPSRLSSRKLLRKLVCRTVYFRYIMKIASHERMHSMANFDGAASSSSFSQYSLLLPTSII